MQSQILLGARPSQRTDLAGLLDVCALPHDGLQAVLHVAERLPRLPALLQTCITNKDAAAVSRSARYESISLQGDHGPTRALRQQSGDI